MTTSSDEELPLRDLLNKVRNSTTELSLKIVAASGCNSLTDGESFAEERSSRSNNATLEVLDLLR